MERTFLLSALNYHKKPQLGIRKAWEMSSKLETAAAAVSFVCFVCYHFSSLLSGAGRESEDGRRNDTNKTFVNGMNLIKIYVTHCSLTEILKHSVRQAPTTFFGKMICVQGVDQKGP